MAEQINGIVLNDLVAGVESERMESQREEIMRVIRGIYNDISTWSSEVKKLEGQVAQRNDQIAKAKAKIESLRKNDWKALPELKPKEPNNGPAQTTNP